MWRGGGGIWLTAEICFRIPLPGTRQLSVKSDQVPCLGRVIYESLMIAKTCNFLALF